MIKKVVLWVLIIICMGAIFFFSSQEAAESNQTSSAFIYNIVRLLDVKNSLTEVQIQQRCSLLHNFVRTAAHFSIFALLGFLISLLLNEYGFDGRGKMLCTVLAAFLYACSDEFHQSFVPGRSAQISDIVTDTLGAFCGGIAAIILLLLIKRFSKKSHGLS